MAKLELISFEFPIFARMAIERETVEVQSNPILYLKEQSQAAWGFDSDFGIAIIIRSLAGEVQLFIRARILGIRKTWKKPLAAWEGVVKTFNLVGNFQGDSQPGLPPAPTSPNDDPTFDASVLNGEALGGPMGLTNDMVSFPDIGAGSLAPGSKPILGPDFFEEFYGWNGQIDSNGLMITTGEQMRDFEIPQENLADFLADWPNTDDLDRTIEFYNQLVTIIPNLTTPTHRQYQQQQADLDPRCQTVDIDLPPVPVP